MWSAPPNSVRRCRTFCGLKLSSASIHCRWAAKQIQANAPHHRQRNTYAPARQDQPARPRLSDAGCSREDQWTPARRRQLKRHAISRVCIALSRRFHATLLSSKGCHFYRGQKVYILTGRNIGVQSGTSLTPLCLVQSKAGHVTLSSLS